ncbi:MAG: hypothetical protein LBQ42_08100 [Synergistaceae bacterium]|jgi:hypothetical protein|nr:hypothetical protein [Synergistaceae bacterium]
MLSGSHAFVATWGDGGLVIGLLAEYDALSNLSQVSDVFEKKAVEAGNGHGCGHNALGAGALAAAGLKDFLPSGAPRARTPCSRGTRWGRPECGAPALSPTTRSIFISKAVVVVLPSTRLYCIMWARAGSADSKSREQRGDPILCLLPLSATT